MSDNKSSNQRRQRSNDVARKYGVGVHKFTHERQIQCIKDLISIAKSKDPDVTNILDCPCGAGRVSANLSMYKLTNADSHSGVIDLAKRNVLTATRFDVCDIRKMPYGAASYDLVLTVLLMQHFQRSEYAKVFSEIARVSRRWVIITYSNRFQLMSLWRFFRNSLICLISNKILERYRSYLAKEKTALSQAEFDRIAIQAGFNRVARRFVLPGVASTAIVLLEK